MIVENMLIISSIVIANFALILTSWINMKLKIKEIDIRMKILENNFIEHCQWGQNRNDAINDELKQLNEKVNLKLDMLITRFDDFRVDMEKRIKD